MSHNEIENEIISVAEDSLDFFTPNEILEKNNSLLFPTSKDKKHETIIDEKIENTFMENWFEYLPVEIKIKIMKEIPCWREKWIEKNSIHGFKIGAIFYIKHTNFPLSDVEKAVRKYEKGVKSTNPFKIPEKLCFRINNIILNKDNEIEAELLLIDTRVMVYNFCKKRQQKQMSLLNSYQQVFNIPEYYNYNEDEMLANISRSRRRFNFKSCTKMKCFIPEKNVCWRNITKIKNYNESADDIKSKTDLNIEHVKCPKEEIENYVNLISLHNAEMIKEKMLKENNQDLF